MKRPKLRLALLFFQLAIFQLPWLLSPTTAEAQTSRTTTANSYLDRGNSWFDKGEWERAMADFDLAIGTDPNLAAATTTAPLRDFVLRISRGRLSISTAPSN